MILFTDTKFQNSWLKQVLSNKGGNGSAAFPKMFRTRNFTYSKNCGISGPTLGKWMIVKGKIE